MAISADQSYFSNTSIDVCNFIIWMRHYVVVCPVTLKLVD